MRGNLVRLITTMLLVAVTALIQACGQTEQISQGPEVSEPVAPVAPVAIGAQIDVTGGTVEGIVGVDGLKQYHKIPYAAAPVGDLRWAPPATVLAWEGVRSAAGPGPACMQPEGQGGSFYGRSGFEMSED